MDRRAFSQWLAATPLMAAPLLASPLSALAQSADGFPARPIKMVVPFPAGGSTDVIGRMAAEEMGKLLKQAIVIDNRGGAGGAIGSDQVARAAADGYTLLVSGIGSNAIIHGFQSPKPNYVETDFVHISQIAAGPNVLVVHPSKLGVKSVAELVALGKQQNGKLTYATYGGGSSSHLYGAMFLRAAGFDAVPVPYKGSAPASADVMAGNVDFLFDSLTTSVGMIQGGRLQGLALASGQRSPLIQNVPTMKEAGFPTVDLKFWLSLQLNAKTPPATLARLRQALYQVIQLPEYQTALTDRGAEAMVVEPATVHQQVLADSARWLALGKDIQIKPV